MLPVRACTPDAAAVAEGDAVDVRPARPTRAVPGIEWQMGAVLRFKSMMAAEGHAVQVARMCFDRRYAFERIALAHTSSRDPLRRLALELFQTCVQAELDARAHPAGATAAH